MSAVASFHEPPLAQLRDPSIAAKEPEYSDEAEATLPLFDKATLIRFAFGVGVVTGVAVTVGVGVRVGVVNGDGVVTGVGVAGVGVVTGVDVGVGLTVGVGVVVTVPPLQASSSTMRL